MSSDGQFVFPVPPRTFLDGLKGFWPYATAIAVAAWVVFTWSADRVKESENKRAESDRQAQVRIYEARKPFLDEQLKVYFEISRLGGQLSQLAPTDPRWSNLTRQFKDLMFGELNSIADDGVWLQASFIEDAIDHVDPSRDKDGYNQKYLGDLADASRKMGQEIKKSIESQWLK
jgi:hypothetical protein